MLLRPWVLAVSAARKQLHLVGFVPLGGKSPQGVALLKKSKDTIHTLCMPGAPPPVHASLVCSCGCLTACSVLRLCVVFVLHLIVWLNCHRTAL